MEENLVSPRPVAVRVLVKHGPPLQRTQVQRATRGDHGGADIPGAEHVDRRAGLAVETVKLADALAHPAVAVFVVYPRFISITLQQAEIEELLPLSKDFSAGSISIPQILVEPDLESVIEGWVKSWLGFRFFQIFWSSRLAELAARIMHLEGSVQEMTKINNHLRMEYFKYLHGLSDRSIRELTAARLLEKES